MVGLFSESKLDGWKEKVFFGKTDYQITRLENESVMEAQSENSASGLFKNVRIDLKKYPYLNWRWRIENRTGIGNEKIKSGDDYAARVYVVMDGGIFVWRTRALNYVWAYGAEVETWENAFAGKNAMMMALRTRQDATSTWYVEKRNVYLDLKKVFGKEFQFIDAVAIMTDTDNSHGKMTAYYGDLYFSEK
ncbi:MAG: DUF3047 domain-containing protein [Proteobacteria bacterium]|nr:DUF3047 domain-containing protein [Pseudomonadota bacterium]MBU4469575.1 DUF3047 domain-containing protein [Pseudomonadota bacterium]